MREPTRLNPIPAVAERARAFFRSDVTRSYASRVQRLKSLEASLRAHEKEIFAALKTDLGKPEHESYPAELGWLYQELRLTLKDLKEWMRPIRASTPTVFWPGTSWQYAEPLGTALIIGPWNYPLQLTLSPVIGAVAAGCTAVVKPSEMAPATAAVVEKILSVAFGDDGFVSVVQGGPEVSKALLDEQWDTVFFTGSTRVGQIVMEAAAKHLTPCTLELGGKSPTLVDAKVDIDTAARRITWGKFYNAGQTCIAPDYVLVHKSKATALVDALQKRVKEFFGEQPRQSKDYGRIITSKHVERLQALMQGGRVAFGGDVDVKERFISPTVLTHVDPTAPIMQEEIFGPILPIIEVGSTDEAIAFVRARPKPLALYTFSSDAAVNEKVLRLTSSGGAVANDVVIHFASQSLPFGGVGPSGTGRYHGKASFEAFSHLKSVVKKPFFMDLKVRYPPYTVPLAVMRKLIR